MKCWVLIGGWIYARCPKMYREFLAAGCRVNFVGCSSGHYRHCEQEAARFNTKVCCKNELTIFQRDAPDRARREGVDAN